MNIQYEYPAYRINIPEGMMKRCLEIVPKLLHEVGLQVGNERFLSQLKGRAEIRIVNGRVFFDPKFVERYIEEFVKEKHQELKRAASRTPPGQEWRVTTAGFSMMVIDLQTEILREATCQDLRDLIKLVNSFGVGGSYMVMPQDLPPLMRAIACYKICWEMSQTVNPGDYQQPEQLPFLYEMHQVMGKPMNLTFNIPTTLTVDPKELDVFLDFYPIWKKDRNIRFNVSDYPMTAITKPVTVPGCATMCFAETLALHILVNLFDPEIRLHIRTEGGIPTDMRHACWAFGSPRAHLFRFLNSMILPNLCGVKPEHYGPKEVHLETGSSGIDEQAALEKMANGLIGALQGARTFIYAGVLCVDDIYSGTQFVIDMEIVNYIKEMIESFAPSPDIVDIEGLFEECKEVGLGQDTFISHKNTVAKFRNIIPSSDLIVREKVRSWMSHRKLLKDRAREIALDRIRSFEPFHLPEDQQKALDRIYQRAEAALVG